MVLIFCAFSIGRNSFKQFGYTYWQDADWFIYWPIYLFCSTGAWTGPHACSTSSLLLIHIPGPFYILLLLGRHVLCMCVYVVTACMYSVCMCVHIHMYTWRLQKTEGVFLCLFLPYSLETGSLNEPEDHYLGQQGWPVNSQNSPVSACCTGY